MVTIFKDYQKNALSGEISQMLSQKNQKKQWRELERSLSFFWISKNTGLPVVLLQDDLVWFIILLLSMK